MRGWSAPEREQSDCDAKAVDSEIRHHALDSHDGRSSEFLRVEDAAGLPATISRHVHPADFNGPQTGADGGAKRLLVTVENDG